MWTEILKKEKEEVWKFCKLARTVQENMLEHSDVAHGSYHFNK